jgi:hypothetical protein
MGTDISHPKKTKEFDTDLSFCGVSTVVEAKNAR